MSGDVQVRYHGELVDIPEVVSEQRANAVVIMFSST